MFYLHSASIVVVEFYLEFGIGNNIARTLRIYCDDTTMVYLSKNNKYANSVKHLHFKYLSLKKKCKNKKVTFEHVDIDLMIINLLNKGLSPKKNFDSYAEMRRIILAL